MSYHMATMQILPNDGSGYDYHKGHSDCKQVAGKLALKADEEIVRLRDVLFQQILIYQVDDQAWDKSAEAEKIMNRLLKK